MRRLAWVASAGPVALLLALFASGLMIRNMSALLADGMTPLAILFPDPEITAEMLLHYTIVPRIVIGLMAGASLGLAGAILQLVLRNPLAEPATLGISAGSHLLLAAATIWFPVAVASNREWVAFAGAVLALSVIMALSWRKGLSPVTVTLSGMIVTLYCGAASAILTLFNHDLLIGIFLWGAGYLDQQDWRATISFTPRFIGLACIVVLLVRPLALLSLDDGSARNLGLSIAAWRVLALVVASGLTAIVTAAVGIISFAGLAAPAIARAGGARTTRGFLWWSGILGALLLAATDQIVLSLPVTFRLFPTGAITALLGAPLLLMLIPRLRLLAPPRANTSHITSLSGHAAVFIAVLVVLTGVMLCMAVLSGKADGGWEFVSGYSDAVIAWRWPRALAALSGGAMLAFSGAILQRMTGNPMASPEVLGVSSGAMLGIIAILLLAAAPARFELITAGTAGAFAVLALMLALSRLPGFSGERLLLIGIALGSVSGFVMAVLMTAQDPRLGQVLTWLSGSTYAVRPGEAILAFVMVAFALLSTPLLRRWLDLLPLGTGVARATGVPVTLSRNILLSLSAMLTASATILVGPLSFAGLMGPHLARLCGFQRAGSHLLASALLGGLILLIADWLGRNILFPFQIPAGLLATVVGGPFLLILIAKR